MRDTLASRAFGQKLRMIATTRHNRRTEESGRGDIAH